MLHSTTIDKLLLSVTTELKITDALLIKEHNPALDTQDEGNDRVLHIF